MRILVFAALTLAGCSAGDGGDRTDEVTGSKPLVCAEFAQRSGTYLVDFVQMSGSCGPQTGGLVRIQSELPAACAFDAPDLWSAMGCTLDRAITCADANGTTKLVSVTTQQDASGSFITGIFTIQLTDVSGDSCTGTYRVSYRRQ
jgi:hypothetical protein